MYSCDCGAAVCGNIPRKVPDCMPRQTAQQRLHNVMYTASDCYSTPMSIYHNGKWWIYGHDLHGSLITIVNIIIRWWGHDHVHEVDHCMLYNYYTIILGSQTKVVLAQCQHSSYVTCYIANGLFSHIRSHIMTLVYYYGIPRLIKNYWNILYIHCNNYYWLQKAWAKCDVKCMIIRCKCIVRII